MGRSDFRDLRGTLAVGPRPCDAAGSTRDRRGPLGDLPRTVRSGGHADARTRHMGLRGVVAAAANPVVYVYTRAAGHRPRSLNRRSVGAADGPARAAAVDWVPVDMWTGPGDGSDAEQCSPEVPASAGPSRGYRMTRDSGTPTAHGRSPNCSTHRRGRCCLPPSRKPRPVSGFT